MAARREISRRKSAAAIERRSAAELDGLYQSPEFLIRRAHQVASAAFAEACAHLNLTPSQYAALFALRQHAKVGQNELGRLVSLDRSTTSIVVKTLRERGLVLLGLDPADRRKIKLQLSDEGRLVLAKAERITAKAGRSLLSVFDAKQAAEFIAMLRKISEAAEVAAHTSETPARQRRPHGVT